MKKSFNLLLMLLGLVVVSCNPMDDIHDEIDAELDNQLAVAEADYVLTEDDYDDLGQSFPNFGSVEDARTLVPTLLSDIYPTYGAGSIINVEFDIYDPLRINDYTLSASDYELIGLDTDYFSGNGEITDFLEAKYPQMEEGDYVSLTYDILAEEKAYTLNDDDYDFVGEEFEGDYPGPAGNAAQFGSFDVRETSDNYWSEDMIVDALGAVISENYGDVSGQKYNVTYDVYTGDPETRSMTIQFDGNTYISVGGTAYEISDADFDAIGDEFATDYPGPAENAARFGSFDVRESSDNYWSEAMILEAINFTLMEAYPNAAEGDQFIVSYAIYSGFVSTQVTNVILSGGEYVIDESASVSTIEETTVYAFTNEEWDQPYSLPEDSYTEEFGQRFSNFGDEEEALTKIAIFLGREFPYATEGELKAVAYQFYNGDETVTEYANFVLENGNWNAIQSVVSETLQFGYEDGMWVPDNTINYRLTSDDYSIIADELSGNNELTTQVASMEQYSNFDRRPGASAYWDDEAILLAMKSLLNEIAANAEEGQKYTLTFDIYNGSNTTESLSLIKEGGEWVVNE
ncbi:hypothetical protein [Salegentibacter salarius]|uniref:DUF5017 domain-containing protein n=1 Tax=Salegentibacter salarius TaxID=435906 RepID=A0A2N0U1Z0_9FLAO|nr:hypothetical protein [Salegentibacter salarius]OEY73707.1 hypothetical protein BHS39_07970 [Salegentibacter salarius]PKD21021.1 hypothetical protein APR40_07965 [Salegentibacter salarius]SLJ94412.1 hypothetical protein SAMN05660445_01592 [Salegentibacter salarius]